MPNRLLSVIPSEESPRDLGTIRLEREDGTRREVIKVIGVGGGGNNALNHIIRSGVTGVEYVAANTDLGALDQSSSDRRVVLGARLTRGLGAGARPEVGRDAALESREELRNALKGADMVYLTAGMGGGTGTGALPVIAQMAKEMGILSVAVVTRPFGFEGKKRCRQAQEGIDQLQESVDALIVVPNDKLLEMADRAMPLQESFRLADDVLRQAVQGVTDLVVRPGLVNVDFADLRTVMANAGPAVMGIGTGKGENRAKEAVQRALESPLMETPMRRAKGVLLNVTGGLDLGIHEVYEAAELLREHLDDDANFVWGYVPDPSMEGTVQMVVIGTGFEVGPSAVRDRAPSGRLQTAPTRYASSRVQERAEGETEPVRLESEEDGLFHRTPTTGLDTPSVWRRRD